MARMMNRLRIVGVSVVVLLVFTSAISILGTVQPREAGPRAVASEDGIDLYFSPEGGAADAVIHEIDQARESVTVAAYYFTSAPIARALLNAQKRGVRVTVLLDPRQKTAQYSSSRFFVNQGIPVYLAEGYASYHHKIMLIDEGTIITGSMNFTKSGDERNAENTLILRDKPKLMAAYRRQINEDIQGAQRLMGNE